jgi:two-component system chemotaxis response regulator CheB
LIYHILASDPGIIVTGIASNGREALDLIGERRPDIITMDMDMPVLNGEETIRIIMEQDPIPIIVVTASLSARKLRNSYRALVAGALAVIEKPVGLGHPDYARLSNEIIRNVRNLAGVKLVRRRTSSSKQESLFMSKAKEHGKLARPVHYVAIGASTGGPPVIEYLLTNLPATFYFPIIIVQHIAEGFLEGFAAWLGTSTKRNINIPKEGMRPEANKIYLAPERFHTGLTAKGRFKIQKEESGDIICPSVAYLFNTLADHFGSVSAGILLTGMGKDGAAELKRMKDAGAVTIAQDEESSVIFGMPGEAVRLEAASFVLNPEEILETITVLSEKSKESLKDKVKHR